MKLLKTLKARARRAIQWMRSRTMRLGVSGVALIPVIEVARAELPTVREFIPDSAYKFLALAAFIAMLWLRVATTRPVTDYERKAEADEAGQ